MSAHRNLLGVVLCLCHLFPLCRAQDAEELFRQGGRLFAEGKPDAAIAAFLRAVELSSRLRASLESARRRLCVARRNFERAETPFRNACERPPSLPDACLYYGRTLYLLNRFQPAIDVFHAVLQRDPENSRRRTVCWRFRSKRSARSAEAGDAFRQALRCYRASAAE